MVTITALFQYMVPTGLGVQGGTDWSVPFMPWPAAMSIFLNVFLMARLKILAFQRFAIWGCFITLFYVLYGVHSTYQAEEVDTGVNDVNSNTSHLQTKLEVQMV